MTRKEIKDAIWELWYYRNGFNRLSGVGVDVLNLRIRKTKVIADIILHTDYEAGISERYNNNEYTIKYLMKCKECLCPLGGDEHNDCKDCAYSGDYHFNPKTKECERRTEK